MSEPRVEITLREIYDEFKEVSVHLRYLINKVDGFKETTDGLKEGHKDHEDRIRVLEKWKYGIPVTIVLLIVVEVMRAIGKGP